MKLLGVQGIADTKDEAIADGQQPLFAAIDALKAVDREPPAPAASAAST
jgi:antitoxin HicB